MLYMASELGPPLVPLRDSHCEHWQLSPALPTLHSPPAPTAASNQYPIRSSSTHFTGRRVSSTDAQLIPVLRPWQVDVQLWDNP